MTMRRLGPLAAALAVAAAGCTREKTTSTAPRPLTPCASTATVVTLGVGAYAAYDLAADSGCAVFPAGTTADTAQYLVVVQSAGGSPGDSAAYSVQAGFAAPSHLNRGAAALPAARVPPAWNDATQEAFDRFLDRRAAALPVRFSPAAVASLAPSHVAYTITPPVAGSLRTFSVCANLTCSGYKPVTARALRVGQHVALYVDTLAPANGFSTADLDSLMTIFDSRVYPLDTAAFGRESDIDSNGVVIALLTNVVNQMVTAAQCDTGGYVTGFFDAADLDPATAAQRNHGEIFYGIVPDPSGTLSCPHSTAEAVLGLPVTFAHEFEHLISYVQHVLVRGGPPEDDWLDEGLAKYAEELTADSYLPGDSTAWIQDVADEFYNAYQYLAAPQRHFLLTTSDQSLADVGAGWLFMRYLVDQMGAGITPKLVQTSLTGTANVAAQAGLPFATLDERWALANWVSDLPGFTAPGELRYTSYSLRQIFYDLYSVDAYDFPLPFPLVPTVATPGAVNLSGALRAGSGIYLEVVQPPGARPDTLHVNDGTSPLPAALVPQFAVIRTR